MTPAYEICIQKHISKHIWIPKFYLPTDFSERAEEGFLMKDTQIFHDEVEQKVTTEAAPYMQT